MKFVLNGFFALSIAIISAFIISDFGSENNAQALVSNGQEALMTIRFNQKTVAYQDQLFYVVSQAVKTKPSVVFDVVDTTPNGQPAYGQQVANDIARIGVSQQQITFHAESGRVNSEEVKIFVR